MADDLTTVRMDYDSANGMTTPFINQQHETFPRIEEEVLSQLTESYQ